MSDIHHDQVPDLYNEARAWVSDHSDATVRAPLLLGIAVVLLALLINGMVKSQWSIDTELASPGDEFIKLISAKDDELMTAAVSQLGVLFVIALFLERALEVYVSAWRRGRREAIEALRDRVAALEADPSSGSSRPQVQNLEILLRRYRAHTRQVTTSISIIAASVIALCGPRLLNGVFKFSETPPDMQLILIDSVDILLTAGLIGGGAAAFHPMIAAITDFFQASRSQLKTTPSA